MSIAITMPTLAQTLATSSAFGSEHATVTLLPLTGDLLLGYRRETGLKRWRKRWRSNGGSGHA